MLYSIQYIYIYICIYMYTYSIQCYTHIVYIYDITTNTAYTCNSSLYTF